MRQLVYQVCSTRYQDSFYLCWIGSVLKYCKVPKYYDQDCGLQVHATIPGYLEKLHFILIKIRNLLEFLEMIVGHWALSNRIGHMYNKKDHRTFFSTNLQGVVHWMMISLARFMSVFFRVSQNVFLEISKKTFLQTFCLKSKVWYWNFWRGLQLLLKTIYKSLRSSFGRNIPKNFYLSFSL